jgi:uncharacterized paraquat-inducible protein A
VLSAARHQRLDAVLFFAFFFGALAAALRGFVLEAFFFGEPVKMLFNSSSSDIARSLFFFVVIFPLLCWLVVMARRR